MKTLSSHRRKFETLIGFLCLYTFIFVPFVKATELVITDNGGGSTNEVTVTSQAQTEVTQTNTAEVVNNVTTDATTGGNSATDNTNGNTSINTGDVAVSTTVDNQVNTSVADTGTCCQSATNATITGNGADSVNNIDLEIQSTNNTSVSQTASITNTITGYANTGKNEASYNTGGNTAITTGDIKVRSGITNSDVNSAYVKSAAGNGDLSAKIAGNGSGSVNILTANIITDPNVFINNYSDIDNFVNWEVNTGKNEANGNSGGDVSITTGNIDLEIFIKNLTNIGGVDIHCCDIYDPGNLPSDGGGNDNGGSNGGTSNSGSSGSNSFSGSSVPAGSEAGLGGAGVLGLSDTGSGRFGSSMFIIGMMLWGLGVKFVGETLENTSLAKKKRLV